MTSCWISPALHPSSCWHWWFCSHQLMKSLMTPCIPVCSPSDQKWWCRLRTSGDGRCPCYSCVSLQCIVWKPQSTPPPPALRHSVNSVNTDLSSREQSLIRLSLCLTHSLTHKQKYTCHLIPLHMRPQPDGSTVVQVSSVEGHSLRSWMKRKPTVEKFEVVQKKDFICTSCPLTSSLKDRCCQLNVMFGRFLVTNPLTVKHFYGHVRHVSLPWKWTLYIFLQYQTMHFFILIYIMAFVTSVIVENKKKQLLL